MKAVVLAVSGFLAVATAAAGPALAIQITKPLPHETVLEENIPEGAPITLAGHYAKAIGTAAPYAWVSIPAGLIYFDYTPDPVKKHTVRIMCKPGTACMPGPLFLKVT